MTEKSSKVAAPVQTTASKKKSERSAMPPRTKANHPPTSEMVVNAIKVLNERSGSSLYAIKKYIAGNYVLDIEKQSLFIRKFINSAVEKGTLVQTKGKGASGSFKLKSESKTSKTDKVAKKPVEKKKSKAEKVEKKSKVEKKPVKAAKKVSEKKTTAAAATTKKAGKKSEATVAKKSIAKKSVKSAAAKPKTPKPKKVTATKASSKKK